MTILFLGFLLLLFLALLFFGRGYWAWVVPGIAVLLVWWAGGVAWPFLFKTVAVLSGAVALVFGLPPLRRHLVTRHLVRFIAPFLPKLGDTERIALEAGSVWWDRELFSGAPDWRKLIAFEVKELSDAEREFLDGPVEELCRMTNDWEVTQANDLPPAVWEFMKQNRFFGMIIPEEYGGLGFSAQAHSAVVTKLSSRCLAAGVTAMVPNSLGPAELLLHYGTDKQKQYYLPRLANGDEIPCFALTEPEAGSDAASPRSTGVVCRGTYSGRDVLGIRLNWDKRYITLSSAATVIGLGFRLKDPDGLIGDREDLGINCALVPADLPGIDIGERHDPLGIPFLNGPTRGRDVFVPLGALIGGPEMIGQGWRMLMERLATGRALSIPGLAVAAAQLSARTAGAYATVREQFRMPIGRFEGIEEPLARIGGWAYLMNAARTMTAAAIDAGESPAVLSAILKAYLTEGMRVVVNDAMDIQAGAAISRGPRNILARIYQGVPIGITVEGANILTRSMIIYGQGAIRSHPYVQDQIRAVEANDLAGFDRAFFKHIGSVFANATRAWIGGLTNGRLAMPRIDGEMGRVFGQLSRMSAAFALVSDAAMLTVGGALKRREKLSGRLADGLAWLYLGSAVLKRFSDDGLPEVGRPYAGWACALALHRIQTALVGVLDHLPNRLVAWTLKWLIFPFGARFKPPGDDLGAAVARGLLDGGAARELLTREVYIPPPDEPGLGRLERTLKLVIEARKVEKTIRDAVRANRLKKAPADRLLAEAVDAGIISPADREKVLEAAEARRDVIQVDSFASKRIHALQD